MHSLPQPLPRRGVRTCVEAGGRAHHNYALCIVNYALTNFHIPTVSPNQFIETTYITNQDCKKILLKKQSLKFDEIEMKLPFSTQNQRYKPT